MICTKQITNEAIQSIKKNIKKNTISNVVLKNNPIVNYNSSIKQTFYNQDYAIQMAKDISTYQYGKRMTGFVQG